MKILFLILIVANQAFAQGEKISLKFLNTESSDKKFKKELGDAFSTFKEDGISGKLVVDSVWKVEVTIRNNRQERKNILDLWLVRETNKKQEFSDTDKFFLIHRIDYSYETAFDLERDAVGTHDPVFLMTLVHLSSGKAQGELTGKRISRYIAKESNDNKNLYAREVVTAYSLNNEPGQLKVQEVLINRNSFIALTQDYQK